MLVIYLKPVLPATTQKAEVFLKTGPLGWEDLDQVLTNHSIEKFTPLFTRIDTKDVEAMIEESKSNNTQVPTNSNVEVSNEIGIDDFAKIDLRVAEIEAAEAVEGADKLLRLTLNVGDHRRQVLSGIKPAYDKPQDLVGRLVIVLANLKPRKMRFGISEGMILAAGPGESDIFLISPDSGAKPGMSVS
ncbi:MAG TPA: methionine--tRNA ligase subunit beta [Gammaproteobacteria bacterium]|nr:methionine--tRNA ligase subunit beta [Gammaproteobacteria bacterium]